MTAVFALVGWSKDARILCNAGLAKCTNCKNMTVVQVVETKRRLSAFLVPVAKFDRKCFTVCAVCSAATELALEAADEMVRSSATTPSTEILRALWDTFDSLFVQHTVLALGNGDVDATAERLATAREITPAMIEAVMASMQPDLQRLCEKFPAGAVEHVQATFLKHLADEDKPS